MSSQIAENLRLQTASLVGLFQDRVSSLRDRTDFTPLFKAYDEATAIKTLQDLLGIKPFIAVGIDGSMDYDERLEMLLFYVCATGFKCSIEVSDRIKCDLRNAVRDSKLSASAAIPLWYEDLSTLMGTARAAETDYEFQKSIERVPYAVMTLAELYLALQALERPEVRLVLVDRPLSGSYSTISRDVRILLKQGTTGITGIETDAGRVTMLDLYIASVLGPGGFYIPPRGPHLVYAAIQQLLRGEMRKKDLAKNLGLNDEQMAKLTKRLVEINKHYDGQLLRSLDLMNIELGPNVAGYWKRVHESCLSLAKRLFEGSEHPLRLAEDRWLTVLDLNTINLVILYLLIDQARKSGKIIIGITKDTTATDLRRALIPYSVFSDLIKPESKLPNLKNDRALLSIFSAVNPNLVCPPWRTLAHDACFSTLAEEDEQLRSARKVISREQLLIRAFFQLRSFKNDPCARSPVFLYDRVFYPNFDSSLTRKIDAFEWNKKTTIEPFFEGDKFSLIDNAILYLLSMADNPEVLEAFGHNQLLYLADKAVKAEVKQMKSMLRGVANLELTPMIRKNRIFSIARRFRDLRSESEYARLKAAQEVVRG